MSEDKKMKAALYIRVSTLHQIDKDSLPFQKKELINYCKYALNIDDYVVFEDAGYSGKDTVRPGYQDMMKRIEEGEFTHIFVWKIDRISRNLIDFIKMYEGLKDYGVTFISKNEQFDTSSAMGEAMLKIILVFAELERKLTAERVKSIMLSRAEKGLWNGAAVPLGYDFDEEAEQPVINEEEAETVKFIYNSYEKLQSSLRVQHELESQGLKTKKNRKWTSKTISDIIRNPFYKGTYRYNYRHESGGKIKPKEEWVVRDDNHPAIVSEEQYNRCNKIMDGNSTRKGSVVGKKNIHIFSLLINCNKCNRNFISARDRARVNETYRPSYYRCFNNVHSNRDNKICTGYVGEVVLGPFIINYIANLIKATESISLDNSISKEKLEEKLLEGPTFESIVGIEQEGLDVIYSLICRDKGHILFESTDTKDSIKENHKLANLEKEKANLERALDRLQNLYLFDDHSMSEKDYLIKKKSISDKLKGIDLEVSEGRKEDSSSSLEYDLGFIKDATHYLMSENLNSDNEIDYNKMIQVIDKQLMKEFINSIIEKININENRTIHSIEFVNGMKHIFVHRD